jgi:YcaO-like protein with predicted kinase domain
MCTSGLFHGSKRMLWMEGFDVLNSVSTWLPYDVIHADYSLPTLSSGGCFQLSTNGLAGGNTLLEAVNHALCEVIERDATTLWNYLPDARKQASEIALDTIADDLTVQLIHKCTEAPFSLRVWDASSDVGVPVFIAELHEPLERGAGVWNKPAYGSGCHPNKDVALIRALTEAAQARTTFIAGARDDMSWQDYASELSVNLAQRRGAAGEPPYKVFGQLPSFDHAELRADFDWLAGRLLACGVGQAVVVDLSQAALGIPVVRVVVPGLEGPDEHYETFVPGARARALVELYGV